MAYRCGVSASQQYWPTAYLNRNDIMYCDMTAFGPAAVAKRMAMAAAAAASRRRRLLNQRRSVCGRGVVAA